MNTPRKPTNLSLDSALLIEARAQGVNLSRAAEDGIRAATRDSQRTAWATENAEALQSSNDHVDTHGLPLQKHRTF